MCVADNIYLILSDPTTRAKYSALTGSTLSSAYKSDTPHSPSCDIKLSIEPDIKPNSPYYNQPESTFSISI